MRRTGNESALPEIGSAGGVQIGIA